MFDSVILVPVCRLFYIARAYASAKKWTEAIALYQRAVDYAQTASDGYKKLKTKDSQLEVRVNTVDQMSALQFLTQSFPCQSQRPPFTSCQYQCFLYGIISCFCFI
jgi:hypothetical protein